MEVKQKDDREFVRSLERGLKVIETFSNEHPAMTLSEVAKRADLTRGSAARFLYTLETLGYVRSNGRQFSLTPRTLRLGYAYLSSQPLWRLGSSMLEDLAEDLGEPVGLWQLDGHDIVYMLASVPKGRASLLHLRTSTEAGSRLPAFCTAAGRVLLSSYSDEDLRHYLANVTLEPRMPKTVTDPAKLFEIIRAAGENGYALQDEEIELNARTIAVPIKDINNKYVAALSMIAFVGQWTIDGLIDKAIPALQRKAAEMTGIAADI